MNASHPGWAPPRPETRSPRMTGPFMARGAATLPAEPGAGWLGEAAPAVTAVSPLAVTPRPLVHRSARTLPVYGVCVHTTGSGPAITGGKTGKAPIAVALDYYFGPEGLGPHYVVGYDGTIYAVCDEGQVAWHAGWQPIGGKARWASWTAPAWWSAVWRPWNAATPADLLPPGARDPNQVYIGVELLADQTGWGFTEEQYDSLARLVLDVAWRHGITIPAAPSPRLLGHEDTNPIGRETKGVGGWDPGAHRTDPKFSWARLWSRMQALHGGSGGQAGPPAGGGAISSFEALLRSLFGAAGTLGSVLGVTEAAAAFAGGERNPDRLTDLVFHARHPERGGRPIARGETQCANEWLWIRDNVVLPALQRAAARAG